MNYAEAAYFNHNACQHVVAWFEHQRLRRVEEQLTRLRRGDRIRLPH